MLGEAIGFPVRHLGMAFDNLRTAAQCHSCWRAFFLLAARYASRQLDMFQGALSESEERRACCHGSQKGAKVASAR